MTLRHSIVDVEPRQDQVRPRTFDRAVGGLLQSVIEIEDPEQTFDDRLQERVNSGLGLAHPIMANLVSQLVPHIKEGVWTAVLGDDSKGRLPALIIGDIMKRWTHEQNEPAPARRFIAAGRIAAVEENSSLAEAHAATKFQNLKERITAIRPELGGRTLVVTEYASHDGIIPLLKAMRESGAPFDLAIVQTRMALKEHTEGWQEYYPGVLDGVEVFTGQDPADSNGPVFAVDTLGNGLIHATGVQRIGLEPVAVPGPKDQRPAVAGAREGTSYMAEELYSQFF